MICVYDRGNEYFELNGDAVLTPTSGSVRQVAGGNYELTLEHPMDPQGKWKHLVPEAVIRAPVPKETIKNAFTGLEADLYRTTAAAALREGPHEPETITYSAWSAGNSYAVGAKVTSNGKNYQLKSELTGNEIYASPSTLRKWAEIANRTSGDPVLVNLKSGTDLYYVSGPSGGWYKMMTKYGIEGYIKSSQVEFIEHLTPEQTQPRTITTQLFRIKTVNADNDNRKVSVTAQHVSYDLNGVMIDQVKIVRKSAAFALAWIEDAFMMDYRGTIASDITEDDDADYTAEIAGKSGMYAIMDPDNGVVPTFDAALRRDNWDLFILKKENEDRGFRIRYGNNMRGVQWKRSSENLVTRVIPVAKDEDGSNLYLSGTKWEDSSRIGDYPVIRMEWLKVNGQVGKDDGTETATNWTKSALRAEMKKQAKARFKKDHADQEVNEITVAFEMMGDTVEYAWLKDLQNVLLYDTVAAFDENMGLSASVTVEELEFDIIKEKITALKLTNVKAYKVKNVSGYNVLNNTITGEKLTGDAGHDIVTEAVDSAEDYTDTKATQTLNESKTYTGSYVGSKGNYSTYDAYIKAYCDGRYVRS